METMCRNFGYQGHNKYNLLKTLPLSYYRPNQLSFFEITLTSYKRDSLTQNLQSYQLNLATHK